MKMTHLKIRFVSLRPKHSHMQLAYIYKSIVKCVRPSRAGGMRCDCTTFSMLSIIRRGCAKFNYRQHKSSGLYFFRDIFLDHKLSSTYDILKHIYEMYTRESPQHNHNHTNHQTSSINIFFCCVVFHVLLQSARSTLNPTSLIPLSLSLARSSTQKTGFLGIESMLFILWIQLGAVHSSVCGQCLFPDSNWSKRERVSGKANVEQR